MGWGRNAVAIIELRQSRRRAAKTIVYLVVIFRGKMPATWATRRGPNPRRRFQALTNPSSQEVPGRAKSAHAHLHPNLYF